MPVRRPLHIFFTIECPPPDRRHAPNGPANWEVSVRTIDAFCNRVLTAGFAPTLFVAPETASQHGPLLEDAVSIGVDVGLLVQPPTLAGAKYKHYLGAYSADQQRDVVLAALSPFEDALGRRPVSIRSAFFSASDDTYPILSDLGFRQASLSSPGRRVPKHHALWDGAQPTVHRASAVNRLEAGTLPLLEVPVTTDASQRHGGISPDLAIENGTLGRWHEPLIAGQLDRQEREETLFRFLCFTTSSRFAFHDPSTRHRQTLNAVLEHLSRLEDTFQLVPLTLASAAAHFRAVHSTP